MTRTQADNHDGTYRVEYDDGDTSRRKPESKIRLLATPDGIASVGVNEGVEAAAGAAAATAAAAAAAATAATASTAATPTTTGVVVWLSIKLDTYCRGSHDYLVALFGQRTHDSTTTSNSNASNVVLHGNKYFVVTRSWLSSHNEN